MEGGVDAAAEEAVGRGVAADRGRGQRVAGGAVQPGGELLRAGSDRQKKKKREQEPGATVQMALPG